MKNYYVITRCFHFLLVLFCPFLLFSQKGVIQSFNKNELQQNQFQALFGNSKNIHAVICGISDYQSSKIPDLEFADRDAIEFANWLQSAEGGNVPAENIQLITNRDATLIAFGNALQQLQDSINEGDLALIYFSGHGDMETKTYYQFGFLLCHDSPPNNYKCGAYAVPFLQDIVSTISNKKAKVILITDACHAGKLAGEAIGGTKETARMLAQRFANEIKIMSCQPDETSTEGVHWGGGRGVFSYYLEKGLNGLADINNDQLISLSELNLFLTTRIPEETFPRSQVPLIEGDPRSLLVHVDSVKSSKVKAEDQLTSLTISRDHSNDKGLEFVDQDSLIGYYDKLFNQALDSGWLMQPPTICANDLFLKLEGLLSPNFNLGKYRSKLLNALHDEVQQALNSLLESDPIAIYNWSTKPDKYFMYPAYLDRCMELIGITHKMYSSLKSKRIYFEAYLKKQFELDIETDPLKKKQIQNEILGSLLKAYRLDSTAAYITQAIADLYAVNQPAQTDSMLYWTLLSIQNSPTWLVPYINLALEYQVSSNLFDSSEYWLTRALAVDSTSIITMERLAWLKQRQNLTDQTISICENIIKRYPSLPNGYITLSHTYAFRRDFENMRLNFEKYDKFNYDFINFEPYFMRNRRSSYFITYFNSKINKEGIKASAKFSYAINLALSYYEIGNAEQALNYVKLAEALNSQPWYLIEAKLIEAKIFYHQGELTKAEKSFEHLKMIDPANPNYPKANAWLAKLAAERGDIAKADSLFNVAITTWIGSAWDDCMPQEECHYLYGRFLVDQERFEQARTLFLKANEFSFQNGYMGWYGLACLEAKLKNEKAALQYLEKSLDCYYPRLEPLLKEPLFKKLRKTKRFKEIISKHFPDKQPN